MVEMVLILQVEEDSTMLVQVEPVYKFSSNNKLLMIMFLLRMYLFKAQTAHDAIHYHCQVR
jgi:hypothetical protein